jgi:hypothetical protein
MIEDDVKKICPTPSSVGLVIHESLILPSKEEGILSRKKQKKFQKISKQ